MPTAAATPRRDRGFALIIVLWTLVLIGFVTARIVAAGRVEAQVAGNIAGRAAAEAAADGAVFQTIFTLMDPEPQRRLPLDGSAHTFAVGDCRVTVALADEAARINPNLVSSALLKALLQVTGSDPETAGRLAIELREWVGAEGAARTQQAMQAQYSDAGLDYRPPGEPAEAIDELQRVLGMTPFVFAAIRPHLSLFAGSEPDRLHADPVVKASLALLAAAGGAGTAGEERPTDAMTVRITVAAESPGHSRTTRNVVVQVTPRSRSYRVLSWDPPQ